jgi:hypothetical protein
MKKVNTLIKSFETKNTVTQNGAISHSTTSSAVLDLFGKISTCRTAGEEVVRQLFTSAYNEDKNLALKTLFYSRDVREGQGERRMFRVIFRHLATTDSEVAKSLLKHVPEFGRWDDVLESLDGTPVFSDALKLISKQLRADMKSEAPSVCAKWAPSEQASSGITKGLAKKVREYMKISPKTYRKMLSKLRGQINIVERKMCSGEWKDIDFESVASRASTIYRKAFKKHTPEEYQAFLKAVEKGEATIKASTLYPYDLAIQAAKGEDKTLDLQWNALPDYCGDNKDDLLVVADTSGSMGTFGYTLAITACVSLALYIAERNKGSFSGYFLNFNTDSHLIKVVGNTLHQKLSNLARAPWGGTTNLQSAFDAILTHAVKNKVPQKEMPSKIIILSDMEFNTACARNDKTNLEVIQVKYKNAGYKMPGIVFWNLNAASTQTPVKFDDKGTCLVSGYSPAILKTVLSGKVTTPCDIMLETLNSERYEKIKA